ncbi:MAG: LytTR family DNA-binding domain-containing protein [Bacteroidota bacterium]
MIKAVFISREKEIIDPITQILARIYPDIQVNGIFQCPLEGKQLIQENEPDLLFIDYQLSEPVQSDNWQPTTMETIFLGVGKQPESPVQHFRPAGLIRKPIETDQVITAVNTAQNRIFNRRHQQTYETILQHLHAPANKAATDQIIGIPTIDGLEILNVRDIIRCEGLQKCTRIVTRTRSDIVSSYNLGEFRKLLENFSFFSPHKSYLVNLHCIKKYYKEGTLLMEDNTPVPVSRRCKKKFLAQILHI